MKNCGIYLQYLGGCRYLNKILFSNWGFNGLFSIDLKEFTVEYKHSIPYLGKQTQCAYGGNVHCIHNDKILFFPYNCRHIMMYDDRDNNVLGVPVGIIDGEDAYLTAGIGKYDEQVWIFPSKLTQGIYKIDLNSLTVEKNTELDKALENVEYIYNYDNVIQVDGSEIAILSGKHSIIGIDLQNKSRIYCKQFEEIDIWGIRYDGSDFWLLLYESTDIYKWNKTEDRLVKYQLLEEEWINGKGTPYVNMIFLDNQIILLPCCLKYIMRIDQKTNKICKAIEYPKGFHFFDSLMHMSAFAAFNIIEHHKILLHPVRGNMLLIYDIEKNRIDGKKLIATDEQIPYLRDIMRQKFCQGNGILYETDNCGIDVLDLAIVQRQEGKNNEKVDWAGQTIFKTIVRK